MHCVGVVEDSTYERGWVAIGLKDLQGESMWVRYVDDAFMIWPHGTEELNRLHDHLNDQHPAIQFTGEEVEKRIPFLDTLVERKGSGTKTSVYWKPTNMDRYIHYGSHYQRRVLRGTLCSMRDRAHNLYQDTTVDPKDELTWRCPVNYVTSVGRGFLLILLCQHTSTGSNEGLFIHAVSCLWSL